MPFFQPGAVKNSSKLACILRVCSVRIYLFFKVELLVLMEAYKYQSVHTDYGAK